MTAPRADAPVELLYAVARSFFELAAQRRTDSFRLPYPSNVQLTLDRVVLDCLRRISSDNSQRAPRRNRRS